MLGRSAVVLRGTDVVADEQATLRADDLAQDVCNQIRPAPAGHRVEQRMHEVEPQSVGVHPCRRVTEPDSVRPLWEPFSRACDETGRDVEAVRLDVDARAPRTKRGLTP